jgi:hypothetical protein
MIAVISFCFYTPRHTLFVTGMGSLVFGCSGVLPIGSNPITLRGDRIRTCVCMYVKQFKFSCNSINLNNDKINVIST